MVQFVYIRQQEVIGSKKGNPANQGSKLLYIVAQNQDETRIAISWQRPSASQTARVET